MDTPTIQTISICSGYGGIELGLRSVIPTRTVCYVENELGVASILAARMEDGSLDPAPVWTDLTTFDPEPWRGRVGLLTGGFPCQPHSIAGRKLGEADPRELSGEVLRIAAGLGYPDLFLENVPGILRFYWDNIRPRLREMGYQTQEGLFTAAEVGAPHRRERLFILAHRDAGLGDHEGQTLRAGRDAADDGSGELAHSGQRGAGTQPGEGGGVPVGAPQLRRGDGSPSPDRANPAGEGMADAEHDGRSASQVGGGQQGTVHDGTTGRPNDAGQPTRVRSAGDAPNELADAPEQGLQEPRCLRGRDEPSQETSAGLDRRPEHEGSELADAGRPRGSGRQIHARDEPTSSGRRTPSSFIPSSENELADATGVRYGGGNLVECGNDGQWLQPNEQGRGQVGSEVERCCAELADADGNGTEWDESEYGDGRRSKQTGQGLADADGVRRERPPEVRDLGGEPGPSLSDEDLGGLPLFPPGPGDAAGWEWVLARYPGLSPTYCKEGHDVQPGMPPPESQLRGVANGPSRAGVDRRLRAVGNGVVPATAARAWQVLSRELAHTTQLSETGEISPAP